MRNDLKCKDSVKKIYKDSLSTAAQISASNLVYHQILANNLIGVRMTNNRWLNARLFVNLSTHDENTPGEIFANVPVVIALRKTY